MLSKIISWSSHISKALVWVGCVLIITMGSATVVDVIGRYLFNHPLPGSVELGTELVVAIIFLSITYVQLLRRHISVDFLKIRLPPRIRTKVDLVCDVVVFTVASFLSWRCILKAVASWQSGEASYGVVSFPYAPARTVVALGLVVFSLLVLVQICERFRKSGAKEVAEE